MLMIVVRSICGGSQSGPGMPSVSISVRTAHHGIVEGNVFRVGGEWGSQIWNSEPTECA